MKVEVIKVGKPAFGEIEQLVQVYAQRIKRFLTVQDSRYKDKPLPGSAWLEQRFADQDQGHNIVVALDQTGKSWSSETLATQLRAWSESSQTKRVTFLIGGPYGLGNDVCRRAAVRWSLSPATLTSDLAWLLCWEQIYRGLQINQGSGYHHS